MRRPTCRALRKGRAPALPILAPLRSRRSPEGPSDVNLTGTLGWSFTLADNNSVLQSLAEGQTITQVYTVTVTDNNGAPVSQDVTVTITGTNDAPVITSDAAAASGAVTEDVNLQDVLDVSGTVVGHDVATSGTLGFQRRRPDRHAYGVGRVYVVDLVGGAAGLCRRHAPTSAPLPSIPR